MRRLIPSGGPTTIALLDAGDDRDRLSTIFRAESEDIFVLA
jgi:hypothetical protein